MAVIALLLIPFALAVLLFSVIYLYRAWLIVQRPGVRTTPGRAVGYLFIPVYGFYWMYVAFYGWAKEYNSYVSNCPAAPRVSEGLFLAMSLLMTVGHLLMLIPYLGQILNGILTLAIIIPGYLQMSRAINYFATE